MSVVLIGYRASGKTTVGKLLADRLGLGFVDTDDRITAAAGKSIKEIFAQHGEEHFRELESAVVAQIGALQNHVISLGGGAILRPANRQAIVGQTIVYLRADPVELHRRIRGDPATAATRPNLTPLAGGVEEIRSVLAGREPIYRQVMTAELDVTDLSPPQVAEAIEKMVR